MFFNEFDIVVIEKESDSVNNKSDLINNITDVDDVDDIELIEQHPYQQKPNRSCFYCHLEILQNKPNQCITCKAMIYCSSDCYVLNI